MREEGRVNDHPVRVSILGSTGSIGTQTLEIARLFPDRINIVCLTAGSNVDLLEQQAQEFKPECVVVGTPELEAQCRHKFDCPVFSGPEGLLRAASWDNMDVVVGALVGAVGLPPIIEAIRCGSRIALANKETLVVAGDLIIDLAAKQKVDILPVDSEHSAIYQCLIGEQTSSVSKLILTASGGPFRSRPLDTFHSITRKEALSHPNWEMGAKITIDSATMMNKGLEVIEARWLFDIPQHKIEVVIHPQSIIHSMVQFVDGSSKAQLGPPDMKVPIQFALSAPNRWPASHPVIHWDAKQYLEFNPPDLNRYPCLELAFAALKAGGAMPAVLNASNEIAVDLFLKDAIAYAAIPQLIERVLNRCPDDFPHSMEGRLEADRKARQFTLELAGTANH